MELIHHIRNQSSFKHRYLPFGTIAWSVKPDADGPCSQLPIDWSEWEQIPSDIIDETASALTKELTKLIAAGWIRITGKASYQLEQGQPRLLLRVYILPDDVGRVHVDRSASKLRSCLRAVLYNVDSSARSWNGEDLPNSETTNYRAVAAEDDSLFYIFNTLPSPCPTPDDVEDDFAANSMLDLLDGQNMDEHLNTTLYHYQRRSAAVMVQRETQPAIVLDPRLETWLGPTGRTFYLDRDRCEILSEKRLYPIVRGGILAETMGFGKTLICLATILATKGYLPEVSPGHSARFPGISSVAGVPSLTEMCASAIVKNNLQWRVYFQEQEKQGKHYKRCTDMLDRTINRYSTEIPRRRRRRDADKPLEYETVYIASTTLIIVPPNLLQQWRHQINLHLRPNALAVFILEDPQMTMPNSEALRLYDIVLLSGTRFEEELWPRGINPDDTLDALSCLCSRPARRRACPEHPYRSPLRDIHFLRLIVDEGQRFVSASTTQAIQGLKCIKVERKWIVSGTPAGGLVGAEVDLAAEESLIDPRDEKKEMLGDAYAMVKVPSLDSDSESSHPSKIRRNINERKRPNDLIEERKAIERLGHIAKSFLSAQPWSSEDSQDAASWNTYVLPRKDGKRKPLSLRKVLTGLVIRHQYEHVEGDLQLPPLDNKLIYLQPCYHDKLSINLFLLTLIANAVTSERTDLDYMFNPRNRKYLEVLIKNVRHAGFAWSGFIPRDIEATCNFSKKFLNDPEKKTCVQDRVDLSDALLYGDMALNSPIWKAFHERGEVGLYVANFPTTSEGKWAFCPGSQDSSDLLLISPTQLDKAQKITEANLYTPKYSNIVDCLEKFHTETGSKALKPSDEPTSTSTSESLRKNVPSKGIPQSGLQEVKKFTGSQFLSIGSQLKTQPRENHAAGSFVVTASENKEPSLKSILKSHHRQPEIPQAYNELSRTKIIGTSSSKLSYLLDRILILHLEEKILVFYEGDDIAYYIAQALELLDIPHLIYASGIAQELRNSYQDKFSTDETYRVLLMDLKQAALGLHLASASRVFFINPVWQPTIEAQAIKRAHRIGQTRPVYVETLVLKDTMESAMIERRKDMTSEEHQKAARSLLDDQQMKTIIQQAKLLSITDEEVQNPAQQYAPLQEPQQVFARSLLECYGSAEAVMNAWHSTWGRNGYLGDIDEAEDQAGIDSIVAAHPEILQAVGSSPRPLSAVAKQISGTSKRGVKKRKLVYIDEMEKRKADRATKAGHSGVKSYAGVAKNKFASKSPRKPGRIRRVTFADEKDLPLVTIKPPSKESTPEAEDDMIHDTIMTGV